MTASHSCINTPGKMYDSSVLVWSNEWLTGNHGDWLQVPFAKNLAPWLPTNQWTYCCPMMTLFKTTLRYIKWICRFFAIALLSVNLTCVWMGLPFTCMHPRSDWRYYYATTNYFGSFFLYKYNWNYFYHVSTWFRLIWYGYIIIRLLYTYNILRPRSCLGSALPRKLGNASGTWPRP